MFVTHISLLQLQKAKNYYLLQILISLLCRSRFIRIRSAYRGVFFLALLRDFFEVLTSIELALLEVIYILVGCDCSKQSTSYSIDSHANICQFVLVPSRLICILNNMVISCTTHITLQTKEIIII